MNSYELYTVYVTLYNAHVATRFGSVAAVNSSFLAVKAASAAYRAQLDEECAAAEEAYNSSPRGIAEAAEIAEFKASILASLAEVPDAASL